MIHKEDWKLWHEEHKRFNARDTKGFRADLLALEQHITRLMEVCPKDKANWPVGYALNIITQLQMEHRRCEDYLNQVFTPPTASPGE